jgi:hypothetical protein
VTRAELSIDVLADVAVLPVVELELLVVELELSVVELLEPWAAQAVDTTSISRIKLKITNRLFMKPSLFF